MIVGTLISNLFGLALSYDVVAAILFSSVIDEDCTVAGHCIVKEKVDYSPAMFTPYSLNVTAYYTEYATPTLLSVAWEPS